MVVIKRAKVVRANEVGANEVGANEVEKCVAVTNSPLKTKSIRVKLLV